MTAAREPRRTLRILSYNIMRGGVGRERFLADVINAQHPDIVVLQEATHPDVVTRLASATGMMASGAVRGRSLGFLSRLPITDQKWVRPRWSHHAFLELAPEGTDVRIVGVHLSAVHSAWTEARRVRELRSLLDVVGKHMDSAHVLIGDFNTLAPGERLDVSRLPRRLQFLVWLSGGKIRWQTIAIVLGAGYDDGFRTLHESDPGFTFPASDPHIRLDYVFLPKTAASRLMTCAVVTDGDAVRQASDHLPLVVELNLEPASRPSLTQTQ